MDRPDQHIQELRIANSGRSGHRIPNNAELALTRHLAQELSDAESLVTVLEAHLNLAQLHEAIDHPELAAEHYRQCAHWRRRYKDEAVGSVAAVNPFESESFTQYVYRDDPIPFFVFNAASYKRQI